MADVQHVDETLSRAELDKFAQEVGLKGYKGYPNKAVVAKAINAVRDGQDAAEVDRQYAPKTDDGSEASQEQAPVPTPAPDQPQNKIHAVNGGSPTKFDATGNPVYDPDQI